MFSALNSYVCQPVVANRTAFVFFHMQNKQMGSTYPFLDLESHDLQVSLYTRGSDQETVLPCHPQIGKYIIIQKQRRQFSCVLYGSSSKVTTNMLLSKVILRSGKLNWNNLDMPLLIAMSCTLWKQPEKLNSGSECNVKVLNKKT